jgi:hypothetical protein
VALLLKALDKCKELMFAIAERGFTLQISKAELEKLIMVYRGIDKRTVNNWMRALTNLGFIKPISPFAFQLDFTLCPEILNKIIEKGQKKLI